MEKGKPMVRRDCRVHGPYDAQCIAKLGHKEVYSLCPSCYSEKLRQEQQLWQPLETQRIDIEQLRLECGLPERFADVGFDAFDVALEKQKEARWIAQNYCSSFEEQKKAGAGLIFFGYVGTGKTLLACAMANALMQQGLRVKYSSVLKITGEIKGSYSSDSQTNHDAIIQRFAAFDLLILDEVGVQNNTAWELNVLYELVNRRYEKTLPSVVIANLDKADLEGGKDPEKVLDVYLRRFLGVRVVDRLKENEGIYFFFDWDSYRKKTFADKWSPDR
jgi:DNA replication protein DnaC